MFTTASPTFGRGASNEAETATSAFCGAVAVAAELLAGLGSHWSDLRREALTGPATGDVTRAVSMAEACGLPSEAIRPQDRLADLWRMQWMGPDVLDLVFRLERSLGLKLPRASIEEASRGGWPEEFGPFAADLVRVLRPTHS